MFCAAYSKGYSVETAFLQVPEFISQRRRWLNGSLFASIHATVFWFRIWTSGQNFFRKIILQVCLYLTNAIGSPQHFRLLVRVHLQRCTAHLHMDITGKLLSSILLREFLYTQNQIDTDCSAQLVSSATAKGKGDAFNFLSVGAGMYVFNIFLNLYIGLLFVVLVCSLGNRPQVRAFSSLMCHCPHPITGFQVDIYHSYRSLWSV